MGGLGVSLYNPLNNISIPSVKLQGKMSTSVAITTGDYRADMVFRALVPFSKQIKQEIGNRRFSGNGRKWTNEWHCC
jgi:hypothetical protein